MNLTIEISEKLFYTLEKIKKSSDESTEDIIWSLLEVKNILDKKNLFTAISDKKILSIWNKKSLTDIFG